MGNLSDNRIDEILTPITVDKINGSIEDIKLNLPKVTLVDSEREKLLALDVNNRVFVEEVISELQSSGAGIVPPFIQPATLDRDLTLFNQMDTLEAKVLNVLRMVRDVKRMAGHEAQFTSLTVYRLYEAANFAGIPGAKASYMNLKKRFEQTPKPDETEL